MEILGLISLYILTIVGFAFLLLALPRFVWRISPPFFWLNWLQWYLLYPFRNRYRNSRYTDDAPYRFFWYTMPIRVIYWTVLYVLFFPFRLLTAFYFDVLLFWSVSLRDQLAELLQPKLGKMRYLQGKRKRQTYYWKWMIGFPKRLFYFLSYSTACIAQGISMFVFDLVWVSLTLYHGTDFRQAGSKIAQTGLWKVGSGDYAGLGLYFGLERRVAQHYARSSRQPCILIVRVNLNMLRPITTLKKDIRKYIGLGGGNRISQHLRSPWYALEHWRNDHKWYEFCITQPNKRGKFINTWRVRSICVLENNKPIRVWGGFQSWPNDNTGRLFVLGTYLVIAGAAWLLFW